MEKNERLERAIVDYVRREPGADSPQVASYMRLRVDLTLAAITSLTKKGILARYWNGRYYELRVLK
jgi:hypothetical protein